MIDRIENLRVDNMQVRLPQLICFVIAGIGLACTGCQTVDWSKGDSPSPNYFKRAAKKPTVEFGKPEKMTCIWKDAVYEKNGVPQTRGFGGRLYFFDNQNRPIKVDGDLVVYGYDDTLTKGGHISPDRKYVFKREDLQSHYSETEFGHSYSIWIPWESVGGERKEVSLVARFANIEEKVICKGSMDRVVLPGRKPDTNPEKNGANIGFLAKELREQLPADFDALANSSDKQMTTTEIPIPENGVIFKRQTSEPTAPAFFLNELHRQSAGTAAIPTTVAEGSLNPQEPLRQDLTLTASQSGPDATNNVTTAGHREEKRRAFGEPGGFR
ncbi:MAG: hypothetical protein KF851_13200 [Pirellulaceae bacterium]|nr:hypothetical protein [Pirellulaceae bacterium]